MIDYLKIPNNDYSILISLFLILLFFIANSFLIGHSSRRFMNTIGASARFIIGSMVLSIILLIFESVISLFGIDHNEIVSLNITGPIATNGFATFIIIQSLLIFFYLFNWKEFRINFNINIWKLGSFIIIFTFLIAMYYGYILKVISPFSLIKGSAFFESIKMMTSFSSNYLLQESLEFNSFIAINGVNIYLLLTVAASINSFGNYGFKNFYIIFKKLALALLFLSFFLIMDGVEDFINYLFIFPIFTSLFGFYWNDKEIIVNDNDKNNVLILTMLSIIIFNYWFLLMSLILAFVFSIKRASNISISKFVRIFIFSLLSIALGFSSFLFPIVDPNNLIFIGKISITFIFFILFIISYIFYHFIKRNDKYQNLVYKMGVASTKNFNILFVIFIVLEYIILLSLFFGKVITIIELGSTETILDSLFSFFSITSLGVESFSFFITIWIIIIILFIVSYFFNKIIKNKYKINILFKKLNIENFESNIIFISFISIIIIFNPLFFPIINLGLSSFLISDGFFELINIEQKIFFLNMVWIIPFFVTISRINEKGFFVIKNYWYLVGSELILTAMIAAFPIYKILTR